MCDLGLRVEPRPVDVPVATAVAGGLACRARAGDQRLAKRLREGAVEDPVAPTRLAGLREEGAERPVAEPVGEEEEVVEHDQLAERCDASRPPQTVVPITASAPSSFSATTFA